MRAAKGEYAYSLKYWFSIDYETRICFFFCDGIRYKRLGSVADAEN